MKILQLDQPLYEYLTHIIKSYSSAGIDPEEALALHHTWQAIKSAVDTKDLVPEEPVPAPPVSVEDSI